MSAVNRQFRLAVRLAETFASASRSLSGWPREAREVQRRTGRASAADRRESRHCLTMINGRCAQKAAIPRRRREWLKIDPKPQFDLWLRVFLRFPRSQHMTSGLTAFCAKPHDAWRARHERDPENCSDPGLGCGRL